MEHKLMKVIKEVNESDLSETNTPVNSPGIFQVSFLLLLDLQKNVYFSFIFIN